MIKLVILSENQYLDTPQLKQMAFLTAFYDRRGFFLQIAVLQ